MSLESIRWVRFIVALIVSFVEFAGWGRRPLSDWQLQEKSSGKIGPENREREREGG